LNKFQNLIDTLRNKQNHVNRENQKFADEADRLIDKLKESIGGGLFSKQLEKEDFSELKGLASEIFDLIKKNRFPSKEQRIAAWDKFNNLRDRLRKEEDEYYSKIREKITKRIDHSQELTNKIINTIDACHPNSSLDDLFELLGKLVLYLTGIGFLIDAVEWLLGIKEEKPKNPLKVKSDALRDVRKFINENKEDITREDKQKIYARLDIVQADLNNAWDEYKKELQRKREEWEERKKLREQKQVEWERRQKEYQQKKINWEKNQREFLEKLADRLEKQNSFKEKLENIYEKQKEFLDKLEKRLDNQQDFLRKLNDQLDDLEDKYSSAWSNNFRDRVSDWIDDKKSKISEVEDDIAGIENKIRDVKNNIDELPNKIRGVEKSIDEIENKIYEVRAKL
jgi:predicted S18 family serine protease